MKEKNFDSSFCHSQAFLDVAKELDTDLENGLCQKEEERRLEEEGKNKLEEGKSTTFLQKFLGQFKEPMVLVLLVASLISFTIFIVNGVINIHSGIEGSDFFHGFDSNKGIFVSNNEYIDGIVVLAIIVINALIGAIQEQKAEQSLAALKKLSTPMCTVKRDGRLLHIKSEDLVLGDLVILEEGSIVPADLRLVTSINLKSDESSLTGESVPVEKNANILMDKKTVTAERCNLCYSSCPISYGRGSGIVIRKGMDTEVGKIASMLNDNGKESTPLQIKLKKLSKQLGIVCLSIVILTFLAGLIWALVNCSKTGDYSSIGMEILSLFEEAIALAVAAIPEGLSAIVTIALALGVRKMVKVNTIVRKLPSVETLGSVTTVCSDKTGTLTQNRMTVRKIYQDGRILDANSVSDDEIRFLATGMMLCSNASIHGDRYGDPTELALLDFAKGFGIDKETTEKDSQPRLDEIPFDSVRKMMSVLNGLEKERIQYTKGALDSILKHTQYIQKGKDVLPITEKDIQEILEASKSMADEAYRILAFAYKKLLPDQRMSEEQLIFVGMVGMIDSERKEAKGAVASLKDAGIKTMMITGDHKDTAFAIASNLGIASSKEECLSGEELDSLSQAELREKVKTTRVFARVSPENKVQIVQALKENGEIVSMTGDGVNDAPSLKIADIGIAMGITGTDVAKSAADMILTDDNFASIEKAVAEGRGIYSNVKKAIFYLLSSNFGEVMTMFFTLVLGLPTPLETLQILWINLITDSLPAIALSMDRKEDDIMKEKPRNPKDGIFSHGGFAFCLGYGFIIFLCTFIGYLIPGILAFTCSDASFAPMVEESVRQSWGNGFTGFQNCMSNEIVHKEATTFAFTILAIAQLFHMIGMSNIKKSFLHVFRGGNWMFLVSFLAGLSLQVFVTEVNGITTIFSTVSLDYQEWLILLAIGLLPLVVHEIMAPIFRRKDSKII